MNLRLPLSLVLAAGMLLSSSCIEDRISTSPDHQPVFSTDTLRLTGLFTQEASPTYSFKVYNPHSRVMSISSIALRENSSMFRLNVDGMAGSSFSNVEIRPNDSIFVFVAVTLPEVGAPGLSDIRNAICFLTNGVTTQLPIVASGRDVERLHGLVITEPTHWTADKPRQIFDSLVVAPDASLTLDPGVELYFHDGAELRIRGALNANGSPQQPILLSGDKRGDVITDVSFDLMSRQWVGVRFLPSAQPSTIAHTTIRNTWNGVVVDSVISSTPSQPALTLINSRLRNAHSYALSATHSSIAAYGCEFADAGSGVVRIVGGNTIFNHCTFANYYLFSALGGPALQFSHYNPDTAAPGAQALPFAAAEITNSIIYGSSADMTPSDPDATDIYVRRSIIRANGTDDNHFINILWGADPLYYTVRNDYIFDYRPQPQSPAIGAADPALDSDRTPAVDFYGVARPTPAALGAFEPIPQNQ